MNKINKRLNNKYEYNNIRVKEYRKLKYENKKEENLLLYLMNYLIILILLSPILSSYSIQLTIPKTDEPNNFVRILYNVHTGNPERIYLNYNEVQSNVSIIKYDGNYVTCNCNSDNCNIKFEWNDERVNLIGDRMFNGCSAITYINFADSALWLQIHSNLSNNISLASFIFISKCINKYVVLFSTFSLVFLKYN